MTFLNVTNEDRANRAAAALSTYAEQTRNDPNDFDKAELLRDLLGDLMHYADEHGLDFAQELTWAEGNYEDERDEETEDDED